MKAIASSTVAYCTEEHSCGIPSLNDDPCGWDKGCMTRYSPGVLLGTTPSGETLNV